MRAASAPSWRKPGMRAVALAAVLLAAGCKSVDPVASTDATLTLVAQPSRVQPGGRAQLTVSAFQASGFPVRDDAVVVLTTDLGRIEPERVAIEGGFASAAFIAGEQKGSATITATSGAAASAITTVVVGESPAALAVSANPASLPAGGGVSQITVTVLDASGSPLPGEAVVLATSAGDLASGGRVLTSDGSGRVRDTLSTAADAIVTARLASGGATASASVDVGGDAALQISLSAEPEALGPGGGSVQLTAAVSDIAGLPVAGAAVVFSSDAGSLARQGVVSTSSTGIASNSLSTEVSAGVTASVAGASDSIEVPVAQAGSRSLALSVSPGQVSDDTPPGAGACDPAGSSNPELPLLLTAQVLGVDGQPEQGVSVSFEVGSADASAETAGRFCGSPGGVLTDAAGNARIYYALEDVDVAFCSGLPSCGCCSLRFTARAGGLRDSVDVDAYCPENPTLTLSVGPVTDVSDPSNHTFCTGGSGNNELPLELTATLLDSGSNPIDNVLVSFSAFSRGVDAQFVGDFCSTPAEALTDLAGEARLDYDLTNAELANCGAIDPTVSCPADLDCCCGVVLRAVADCVGSSGASVEIGVLAPACTW